MASKVAGSAATPLANWKRTGPIQGTCIEERLVGGTIVFSTAGAVSAVSGIGVSAVTVSTGVYRVYVPAAQQFCITLTYGSNTMFANGVGLSNVSATSGYFDMLVYSAAALSAPSSGDFVHLHVLARTRKASA